MVDYTVVYQGEVYRGIRMAEAQAYRQSRQARTGRRTAQNKVLAAIGKAVPAVGASLKVQAQQSVLRAE
jgi:hypothetical protein